MPRIPFRGHIKRVTTPSKLTPSDGTQTIKTKSNAKLKLRISSILYVKKESQLLQIFTQSDKESQLLQIFTQSDGTQT